ncbi:GntR family transcriptional regulator [Microbacterium sp. LTA6]|uniref:GntR family transcriptional regulator n=1 Tax=Microbacterium sp. LTA6 TaxID=3129771 RepID=UPI00325261CC
MSTIEQFFAHQLTTAVGQPLRVAVYSRLAEGIRSNVFPLGQALPRETELATAIGVSRTVVREALMLLEEDGLIVTRRGVGRFVVDKLPHIGLEELQPLEHALTESGRSIEVRQLEFGIQSTTDFTSNKLSLDAAANTWFREAVILSDGTPIAIAQEHLPAGKYLSDIHPGIATSLESLAGESKTLLAAIIDRFGPVFSSGVCTLAANVAGETRAGHLDLKPSTPVLVLTQTAEYEGTPLYLAKFIVSPEVGSLSIVQSTAS